MFEIRKFVQNSFLTERTMCHASVCCSGHTTLNFDTSLIHNNSQTFSFGGFLMEITST